MTPHNDHDLLIRIDERTAELMRRWGTVEEAMDRKADKAAVVALQKKVTLLEKITYMGIGGLAMLDVVTRLIWK